MDMSRSQSSSRDDGMPTAAAIIAAATIGMPSLMPRPVSVASVPEENDELVRMRAAMVCPGCRYGWLCCDCSLGCLSCKQRRRFCYCRWTSAPFTGELLRIQCEICIDLRKSCQCYLTYRCKWCTVSLGTCRRGGCVALLPDRTSQDAVPYVNIFRKEEIEEDDDEVANYYADGKNATVIDDDGVDKRSTGSSRSGSSSLMSWSSEISASTSAWSVASNQSNSDTNSDTEDFGSTYTLSSTTSGGSYSSVGGKSDL